MRGLSLWFETFKPKSKQDDLSVRTFSVREAISQLFEVSIMARSQDPSIDLESIVGRPAAFSFERGDYLWAGHVPRKWQGICNNIEQIGVEDSEKGESTYVLTIVPELWLLAQKIGYKIFQHSSIPDIVQEVLKQWGIKHVWNIDRASYPKLEYRVQYGESEFSFVSRLLEEAGIAYTFPDQGGTGTVLEFSDALAAAKPHPNSPLLFADSPNRSSPKEYITSLQMSHGVRPGAYLLRDYDFRRPDFKAEGEAPKVKGIEGRLEQYYYRPGSLLVENGKVKVDPVADDKGVARRDEAFGAERATRSLHAERHEKRVITYETNSMILAPGVIFAIQDHPHQGLKGQRLLATEMRFEGSVSTEWEMSGRAVFAADPYHPPQMTPKPEARGIESAIVVGPRGQEIHADEFGRVRVQFPWDREGKNDANSSCWMRVSQGWAGVGFGGITIPRVGQEVLVAFLGADPDQPIVVGRMFNAKNVVPYKLPEHETRSTWKSASSPGGNGFNEIMFDDAKGKEQLYVQAERNLRKLVKNDELERTHGFHRRSVGKDQDLIVEGERREHIRGDSHLIVDAGHHRRVGGDDSTLVGGSREEKIEGRHALSAGTEIRLEAGTSFTIKGPGGFLRIDAQGITIEGRIVNINCAGVDVPNAPRPERPIPAEPVDIRGPDE